ncbi:MAG: hypothetical protein HUJ26_13845 [Planctomycetaceae bacterium]|nr:hypothetical protein [Planctomycetaceae bacterium]
MKLVVIHFHLNRGGVTSVILNHLRALQQFCPEQLEQVALLYGGRDAGVPAELKDLAEFPIRAHSLPELEYDSERGSVADQLSEKLMRTLQQLGFHPSDTILHAHNHSLGKNVAFLSAIEQLTEQGWRWLLQIHDFAEDFRPDNYRHLQETLAEDSTRTFGRQVYPQAKQIHYAVLNGRDREIFLQAGVPGDRLHLLPNPVFAFKSLPQAEVARRKVNEVFDLEKDQHLLVYPVRGIRRKNVGEMLLWSVVGRGEFVTALTLPPANPIERSSYEEWKSLSERLKLPCRWEIGAEPSLTFEENLAAADHILTTSVAEGFGMVFLEAWLAGKPLCGRDLPEITHDFKQVGLWYPQLAAHVLIPIDLVDLERVREDFLKVYCGVLRAFGLALPDEGELQTEFDALIAGDTIDFAVFTRSHQARLIERLVASPAEVDRVLALNPVMQSVLKDDRIAQQMAIDTNAETVLDEFSLESTGRTLHNIYQSLLEVEPGALDAAESPGAVRDGFLKLTRFQPLRVEP